MYNCSLYNATTNSCIIYDATKDVTTSIFVEYKPPLLTYETKKILEYIIHIGLFYVTSLVGVTVNIINIIVYKKQGLKESITIGLFTLSISDLFVAGLPLETATCYALKFLFPDSNVQFVSVHYVHSSWNRRMFYSFSCLTTALLSLERCFCVISPFKVKSFFTRSRTVAILLILVIIHVASFAPIYLTHRLKWVPDPNDNTSEVLRLFFSPNRDKIEDFNSTLMAIITPTLAQAVVTVCVVVMIHGLRQSSKFRNSTTSGGAVTNSNNLPGTNNNQTTFDSTANGGKESNQEAPKRGLSQRDARLVRTMIFIVAILSACNIPNLIMTYAILMVTELNMHRRYHNTYSLIFSINYVLSNINATLNFFIYYKTSTRYKEVFNQVFCRQPPNPNSKLK